ncbi:MAG: glycosyltransferase family 4 protein, partial [Verrucomicrobiota bacterium]|nr:glycosyltransferase family 4 protein [Verrucomicrobiota bacterium]
LVYGQLADFIVTTCASILPMIAQQSGKSLALCRSIATGVDPNQINVSSGEPEAFRRQWRLQPDDFLVGTACFMRSWKGIDDLLKAADLLRDIPNLKWIVIGGGHAERHHQFAKTLKLSNVVFTGHLDHPFPAIAALDVFALLSTAHEGVSQAILQAAYLGKPLISTRTGGLGEVCIDEQTGFNVSPFAPTEVAQKVMQLKESGPLRQMLGEKAHRLVLEQFTFSHTLDHMEEVYQRVL